MASLRRSRGRSSLEPGGGGVTVRDVARRFLLTVVELLEAADDSEGAAVVRHALERLARLERDGEPEASASAPEARGQGAAFLVKWFRGGRGEE